MDFSGLYDQIKIENRRKSFRAVFSNNSERSSTKCHIVKTTKYQHKQASTINKRQRLIEEKNTSQLLLQGLDDSCSMKHPNERLEGNSPLNRSPSISPAPREDNSTVFTSTRQHEDIGTDDENSSAQESNVPDDDENSNDSGSMSGAINNMIPGRIRNNIDTRTSSRSSSTTRRTRRSNHG